MSKFKVSELKCFGQVADVIGKAQAEIELFKVVGIGEGCNFGDEKYINGAFYWDKTPQGFDFWLDISNGFNPYDN
ncbi:hypothetical protein NVP1079O_62 [Vibrio phage 1.079.O._10N.286.45.E9]|nr:hypothetical protein NVP1079O_62 [Vibrio phage 1.079.O._10N.286.45.E9]